MISQARRVARVVCVLLALAAVVAMIPPDQNPSRAGRAGGNPSAWQPQQGTHAEPQRWNPCAPIPYFVNPSGMPSRGVPELREALRRVSEATGLVFRYSGRQRTVPSPDYGGPRSGILIAWGTPASTKNLLGPEQAGMAHLVAESSEETDSFEYVRGYVLINIAFAKQFRQPTGFGPRTPSGYVLLHELGHIVGLDHVDDPDQIMNRAPRRTPIDWGAGDRAGLRALGIAAGCIENSRRS